METRITLTAENKAALNTLIDIELKSGYLLHGSMYSGDDDNFSQVMIQPNNIDGEVSGKGFIKFAIGAVFYAAFIYYYF